MVSITPLVLGKEMKRGGEEGRRCISTHLGMAIKKSNKHTKQGKKYQDDQNEIRQQNIIEKQ